MASAPLDRPKIVAEFLASHARDALATIEAAPDDAALAQIRKPLEDALGITFHEEKGRHFFHSTLVQTLFYGLFSAWVLWHEGRPRPGEAFRLNDIYQYFRLPMLSGLLGAVNGPAMEQLGLREHLERAVRVLDRVDRPAFFASFETEGAVQYFYEPFLAAFDPVLRRELGVWYTPVEIVRYMVGRVDQVLRTELNIPDGLADERVVVLDPCCGTGAYLVETLRLIQSRLTATHGEALAPGLLRKAATERVFGFELLPAPYVVAHLQLGLVLARGHAALEGDQRAGVFLTNALTGWDPAEDAKRQLNLYIFQPDYEKARAVKRDQPILVILGNPPYNGYAGITQSEEERRLSEDYRTVVDGPKPQGQGLNDLYVRFYRMAERRIVEGEPGRGVVCFISNYSWLDSLSCPGMRERYLQVFDRIWIDNLHGDRKIGEYAPDGRTSETIFALAGSSPGIRIGTAIATLVKGDRSASSFPNALGASKAHVAFRDHTAARAEQRRKELEASLTDPDLDARYRALAPDPRLGYPFKPRAVEESYLTWLRLPDLLPTSFPGVKTSRDDFLVDIDRDRLEARIARYFDRTLTDEDVRRLHPEVMTPSARYDPVATRRSLLNRGPHPGAIRPYHYRPFDVRWLYWDPDTKLLDEKRSEYVPHVVGAHLAIEARPREVLAWCRGTLATTLADQVGNGMSHWFVQRLRSSNDPEHLFADAFSDAERVRASWNLSDAAWGVLDALGLDDPGLVFHHVLATLHTPAYREANAGALRQDWPRIPWPKLPFAQTADMKPGEGGLSPESADRREDLRAALEASAALGRRVAALLDPETPVPGVTAGPIDPLLQNVGVWTILDGSPPQASDYHVTAHWGYRGQGGVVMPATGRLLPGPPTPESPLGSETVDVALNDRAVWRGVPRAVWEYKLGGYPVLKKWLSYRERDVLGRPLKPEEIRHFTDTARRITALLLLGPELDAAHARVTSTLRM